MVAQYLEYAFLLAYTLVVYFIFLWIYRKSRISWLNPLILSAIVIIIFLYVTGIPYERFRAATHILDLMLGPTVVALGWALYKQIEHLKVHYASILTSVAVGSLVGIVSVTGIMRLFGASYGVEVSVVPKSVTTPIAIQISHDLGGIPSLTAVVVVLTGVLGSIIAPAILRRLGVTDAIARGLAIGSAAHGIGTTKAMELGALEGAISGLAIGLMGLVTAILAPLIYYFLSL